VGLLQFITLADEDQLISR